MNRKYTYPFLFAIIILLVWEFLPYFLNTPIYIFPRLSDVWKATFQSSNSDWLEHLKVTATESFFGFVIGSSLGLGLGFSMSKSKNISNVLLPYVIASNAIPVIAIAPIIIMWFGNGILSKIAVSAFLCFFPLSINTYQGLNSFSVLYQELFQTYGATEMQFYKYFRLRNAFPFIFTGLKLNATFSVIGSVVGEIIASDSGLGYGMLQAVYNLNMPKLWGLVSISCILGVSAYGVISLIGKFLNSKNKF
jgi:NitT/TauT family transport system permease protein